ncbi:MAG TPA: hypothetical protein DDZ53_03835 [Firmicutes bacterium]|jgi:uncharacterized membrane protein YobD (UPF0266 family)|nr:hypothetical protein [Bacillota bacterium]
MRVKSAVDWWIGLLIWFAIGMMLVSMAIAQANERTLVYLLSLPTLGFMLWLYFGTFYELRDEYLYCRSGPFFARIPYASIRAVKLSQNPLSSMALSTKRIEVTYDSKSIFGGLIYISPCDREQFRRELVNRCPNVT